MFPVACAPAAVAAHAAVNDLGVVAVADVMSSRTIVFICFFFSLSLSLSLSLFRMHHTRLVSFLLFSKSEGGFSCPWVLTAREIGPNEVVSLLV